MTDPFQLDVRTPGRSRPLRSAPTDIDSAPTDSGTIMDALGAPRRWTWLLTVMVVILVGLVVRASQLQLVQGQAFRLKAEGNRIRTIVTPAPRGAIVDRTGNILADNTPNLVVTIVPSDLPKNTLQRTEGLTNIARATGIPIADIMTALQSKQRRASDPVTIAEHLTYDQAITNMVATANIPAVSVTAIPNRSYPTGTTSANILGYTGRISPDELLRNPLADPLDIVGKTGLERQYNQALTGRDGTVEVERDVQNRIQRVIARTDPQPGQTVVTTLDANLQRVLNDALQAMVRQVHSTGGAAVAMDPSTGEILALASAPTYDNSWFVTSGHNTDVTKTLASPGKPLLNRAISGQYPSGSIIKPLIASAALTEGTISPSTTVNSVGGFEVGHDYFPDWKSGGHGLTNVTKAIAESVNTFFYAVGGGYENITGLGVERIVKYLQRFGWGEQLGVDIPAEASGFLPTKEWRTTERPSPWKLGDTYHLSIGQGDVEVTPLQIVTAMSAIANGGTLYQPHVVREIRDANGATVRTIAPDALSRQIIPGAVLGTVQQGMRQGVLAGSSRSLQSLPVTSAGKTGTAQFGNQGKTHSWYTAYAPYEQPKIVITVIVEGGGEGNTAALPVAKTALQWYFTSGAGASAAKP